MTVRERSRPVPTPRGKNPYLQQTPTEILERAYNAGSINISGTTAEFAEQFGPPMFDAPAFIKAASTFRYIRWKSIEYTIQILSSPFLQGWIGATGIPWSNDGTYNQRDGLLSTDFGNLSHDDAMILDISSGEQHTLEIPWLFNSEWLDMLKFGSAGIAGGLNVKAALLRLASLKLFYIFQALRSNNSTVLTLANVIVFARLKGVECCGPRVAAEYTPPLIAHESTRESEVKFQADNGARSLSAVLGAGMMGMIGTGISGYANRQATNAVDAGVSIVKEEIAEFVGVDMPEDVEETGEPVSQAIVNDGSESTNVIPSVFGSMGYGKSVNVLGPGSMRLHSRSLCNSIKRILKKPSLINLVTIPYNLSNTALNFEMDPFPSGLVPATASDQLAWRSCSRIMFFGNFFRFWRGTVNYTFVFISSPLVVWKLRLILAYAYTGPLTVGDTISQIVTIKGSTVITLSVPFLYTNPWRICQDSTTYTGPVGVEESAPYLNIQLAAPPISSGDINASMDVLVYQSAGDDFQFASPKEPMFTNPDGLKFQMKVSSFCKKEILAPGSADSPKYPAEEVLSCESLAKRWSVRYDEQFSGPDPITAASGGLNTYAYSTFEAISMLFLYWHGQYKLKFQFTTDPNNPPPSDFLSLIMLMEPNGVTSPVSPIPNTPNAFRFNDGSHAISASLTQVFECTIPFLSNTEWIPVWKNPADLTSAMQWSGFSVGAPNVLYEPILNTAGSTTGYNFPIEWVAVAAGNDFVFAYDLPPPSTATRWYWSFPPDLKKKAINSAYRATFASTADKSGPKQADPRSSVSSRTSELLAAATSLEKRKQRRPISDLS